MTRVTRMKLFYPLTVSVSQRDMGYTETKQNYFVSIFIICCSYYNYIDAFGRDDWHLRCPDLQTSSFPQISPVVQFQSCLFLPWAFQYQKL